MFDDLLSDYNALEAELQKRREELSSSLRPKFHAAFLPVFDRNPGLETISFTAYTPYFNDGDECVFGVNEPEMAAFGMDLESWTAKKASEAAQFNRTGEVPQSVVEAFTGWAKGRYDSPEAYLRANAGDFLKLDDETLIAIGAIGDEFTAVQGIIDAVPNDVMKGMFGDHVKIVITREGAEAEEYDHD